MNTINSSSGSPNCKFVLNSNVIEFDESISRVGFCDIKANEYLKQHNIALEQLPTRGNPSIMRVGLVDDRRYILTPEFPLGGFISKNIKNQGLPISHLLFRNSSNETKKLIEDSLEDKILSLNANTSNKINPILYSTPLGENILIPLISINPDMRSYERLLGIDKELICQIRS